MKTPRNIITINLSRDCFSVKFRELYEPIVNFINILQKRIIVNYTVLANAYPDYTCLLYCCLPDYRHK